MLGAAVAQCGFAAKLGPRAILIGAATGIAPDFDTFVGLGDPIAGWINHRGLTHSLLFAPVAGVVIGSLTFAWHKTRAAGTDPDHPRHAAWERGSAPGALSAWIWLFILCIGTHPLLDLFTPYGTQLLAPLTNHRFAIDAIAIIDPIYTGFLIAGLVGGLVVGITSRGSMNFAAAGLVGATAYLFWTLELNDRAEQIARDQLRASGETQLADGNVRAYPTIFQAIYRRIVVETDQEILVGFVSATDPQPITWMRHQKPDHALIAKMAATYEAEVFTWFALERIVWDVEAQDNGEVVVKLTDSRYGGIGPANEGFWGLQMTFDAGGNALTSPTRYSARPAPSNESFRALWDGITGRAAAGGG